MNFEFTGNRVGSNDSLNMEDVDFTGLLFLDTNEYLPFATLFINNFVDNKGSAILGRIDNYGGNRRLSNHIDTTAPHLKRLRLKRIRLDALSTSLSNIMHDVKEGIKKYVEEPVDFYMKRNYSESHGYSKTSYSLIANSVFNETSKVFYLQSMKRLVAGKGMIYHEHEGKLLMSLVFKNTLTRYHKLYYILNGKFDWSAVEFWVNEDIDTPQYQHQSFRKMYRNEIRPFLQSQNIPIVTKADLNADLVSTFEVPQSSISELLEWKSQLLETVLNQEREAMTFNFQR